MWELDHKESWALKNWCFELWCWGRLLRVPWTARRSNHSILNQSWIFNGRTDVEAEAPILWPPNAKNWHIEKDHDAGKAWKQEEKGTTEDEMVGWHHQLNGHEFEQALGVGNGQASLAWCSSQVPKSQTQMNHWSELSHSYMTTGEAIRNPFYSTWSATRRYHLQRTIYKPGNTK